MSKYSFVHVNLQKYLNVLLTLYHMNIALKAFSFEQDPQDMVITCDKPLGATCQQRQKITPEILNTSIVQNDNNSGDNNSDQSSGISNLLIAKTPSVFL